ncbi:D-aminoacyl-tRNA deacylase [Methanotrichaceae archaeon M04Ac]|jgi:D-aminoacyl-tRNA deacylase|uniref:D-aminoacyl-tRNA deacylase n=1 Tax=Candidatus Methanocrinis alkalitolerans TaxID=3033395 RepID=A0ABT5XCH8_9EURY|nr:D-aminoacyl-tRNA deacylase [Candidatus Methanocrinis alkalitolerans]MDF0592411.1 D-aminoacyl-tRNA deacylase [Candidatus Methanocrinis alkalitolerans]
MTGDIVVVATRCDPASLNIAESLMSLAPWEDKGGLFASFKEHRLVILGEKLISLRGLEERLGRMGLSPELIVFASRHQAKDAVPRLCGHFSGNPGEAVLGGSDRELAVAAPKALKSFILNLAALSMEGFEVTVEATHHGPTDLSTPSFFAEIGSGPEEWRDPAAGEAVARSILELSDLNSPPFIGFGGGHYLKRQNQLLMETNIAFGHLFSNYQAGGLDAEVLEEARRKSGAVGAYLDRKSLRSADKRKIIEGLEEIGLPAMIEGEIREIYPLEIR